jgi:RecA/RadA recombinase
MATKKAKEKEEDVSKVDYLALLSQCEKVAKIQSVSLEADTRLSTGLLCLDGIMGGGVTAGMYTFFGPEQSAKTTAAITIMGASVSQEVGQRILWDAENSTGSSTDYVTNIFKTMHIKAEVETLFGVKKEGKYLIKPLVYYQDIGEADAFFNFVSALLRRLPIKRYENKKWWTIYEKTKENLARYSKVMDADMSDTGIYVPAENGSLQAIIVCDSYPGLVPDSMDDDDPSAAIAQHARAMSAGMQRIKGKLRSRRVALVGVNQLRLNPMQKFGSPEYEPGGGALKFFSDVRMRFYPRALNGAPFHPKGEGMIEREAGINGGYDTYRYINVRSIKNKLSIPNRETWLRVWIEDAEGAACGYDPVWDTFYAMALSGQVSGKRSAIRLEPHGVDPMKKTLSWLQFKQLVIGSTEQKEEVCKFLGMKRVVNLRSFLRKQMQKGVYEDLYVETKNSKAKEVEE